MFIFVRQEKDMKMKDMKVKDVINNVLQFTFLKENNNRSSKRTDMLHKSIIDLYLINKGLDKDPEISVKYEHKIKCFYGKTFSLDAVIFRNGEIETAFLFKLFQTSIIKNIFNSMNTKFGEIGRVVGSKEYLEKEFNIVFFEVKPTTTYTILKNNSVFNIENVMKRYSLMTPIKKHPFLSKMNNLYDYTLWFDPTKNFFDVIKQTNRDKSFGEYSDFVENVDIDFNNLP